MMLLFKIINKKNFKLPTDLRISRSRFMIYPRKLKNPGVIKIFLIAFKMHFDAIFILIIYAFITLDGFYASDLVIMRNKRSKSNKMIKINNIKPLDNAKTSFKGYKSAIRGKLREIFASQYPNITFNLRAYEIENLPSGIHSHDTEKWSKSDLLQINEMIPYIRFVPRKTVIKADYSVKEVRNSLREMECLTSFTLREDYLKEDIMDMMFERFRLETGRLSATKIDWGLLDRRQVPKKYKNVPLKSATVNSSLIFKNPEIIDNIHFYRTSNNDTNIDDSETDNGDNENVSSVACSSSLDSQETKFTHQPNNHADFGDEDGLEIDGIFAKYMDSLDFEGDNSDFETFLFSNDSKIGLDTTDFSSFDSKPDHNDLINLADAVELGVSVTKKYVHDILLTRYREETGEANAFRIKWSELDRRDIPAKYKGAILDSNTIKLRSIFRNPEIIDNIHFYKPKGSENRQRKRKLESDSIFSDYGI